MPASPRSATSRARSCCTTANAGVNTFFPLVLKNAGLTEADVAVINVPDGALVSSYLQGAGGTVGLLGGLDDKPAEIKANGGAAPVTFAYSDFGVNQVGYCIAASKKPGGRQPGPGQALSSARRSSPTRRPRPTRQAAIDAMGDIVGGTMNEEAGKKQALAVQKVTLDVLYSKANKDKVLGLNVPEDWTRMIQLNEDL